MTNPILYHMMKMCNESYLHPMQFMKEWIELSMENQIDLLEESMGVAVPWNEGYLDCLNDIMMVLLYAGTND